jgi:hypothetical protein
MVVRMALAAAAAAGVIFAVSIGGRVHAATIEFRGVN